MNNDKNTKSSGSGMTQPLKSKRSYAGEVIRLSSLIRENPWEARYRFDRANCHRQNGRHDLAIVDYNVALALDPTYAEAYFYKAVCCARLGYTIDEITAYEQFLVHASGELAAYAEPIKRRVEELRSRRLHYKHIKIFRKRPRQRGVRR